MCVNGHALLSALVARLRRGEADAERREIEALLKTGCSYADIEGALSREKREEGDAFQRALGVLRATRVVS